MSKYIIKILGVFLWFFVIAFSIGNNILRRLTWRYFKLPKEKFNYVNNDLIRGVDFVYALLADAEKNNYNVFLIGGWPKDFFGRKKSVDYDLASKASLKIKNMFPKLNVIGASSQYSYMQEDDALARAYIRSKMAEKDVSNIDLLLVAYKHGSQEKWLKRNVCSINAKVGIGVGGTFDYIAEEVKRAPEIFRLLYLEWLYRIIMQPWRIKRIYMAFLVFPTKLYLSLTKE